MPHSPYSCPPSATCAVRSSTRGMTALPVPTAGAQASGLRAASAQGVVSLLTLLLMIHARWQAHLPSLRCERADLTLVRGASLFSGSNRIHSLPLVLAAHCAMLSSTSGDQVASIRSFPSRCTHCANGNAASIRRKSSRRSSPARRGFRLTPEASFAPRRQQDIAPEWMRRIEPNQCAMHFAFAPRDESPEDVSLSSMTS